MPFIGDSSGPVVRLTWSINRLGIYEIRRGENWASGQLVASVYGNNVTLVDEPSGTNKYWLKSKSALGQYPNPVSVEVVVSSSVSPHTHVPGDVTGTAVIDDDARLSDARTPLTHGHAPADVTGTAVIDNDGRLSDARVPTSHGNDKHSSTFITAAEVTYENLDAAGDVGSSAGQVAVGDHTHPGGGAALKQTEVDFGATPLEEKDFTVTDGDCTPSSVIVSSLAYAAATSKDADESEMDPFFLLAIPATGSFTLKARGLEGLVYGAFKINYAIG